MTVLFVVATILVFLTIDFFVRRTRESREIRTAPVPNHIMKHSNPVRIPEGIFFARSHTWLNIFPSGKVYLGIDDFITRLLDKPQVTLLNKAGDRVRKGDPI